MRQHEDQRERESRKQAQQKTLEFKQLLIPSSHRARETCVPQEERMLHAAQGMMEERMLHAARGHTKVKLIGTSHRDASLIFLLNFPRMFHIFSFSVKLKTTRTETSTSTMRQTFASGCMFTYCDAHGIKQICLLHLRVFFGPRGA